MSDNHPTPLSSSVAAARTRDHYNVSVLAISQSSFIVDAMAASWPVLLALDPVSDAMENLSAPGGKFSPSPHPNQKIR